ncbi:MAG TPA: cyclophilin-like fold protein [Burkholderiales bacterium]|nr:cyclophilin-like fold protein [Burkholderiales bacterium]
MNRIRIKWPKGELTAQLADTPTARAVVAMLPAKSRANTWGEEVYFALAADVQLERDAREVVDPGTVCFWVQGGSLALPYGPTPVSSGNECRLVTKVNVLGKMEGDARKLATVRDGDAIEVTLA